MFICAFMHLQLSVFNIFLWHEWQTYGTIYCYLLHFALQSFPSDIRILLTSVYCFDMTVLYSLMRWFLGEILNSLDTRKPKTHFCQYYKGYQTYPYLSNAFMMLKKQ